MRLNVGFIFFHERAKSLSISSDLRAFVYFEMVVKSDLIGTRIDLLYSKEILCLVASD